MTDRWLLEDGSGYWELEDSSGNWLLESSGLAQVVEFLGSNMQKLIHKIPVRKLLIFKAQLTAPLEYQFRIKIPLVARIQKRITINYKIISDLIRKFLLLALASVAFDEDENESK